MLSFNGEACRLAPGALLVEHGDKVQTGEVRTPTDCGSGVQAGLCVVAFDGHRLHTGPGAIGVLSKSIAPYLFHGINPQLP